MSTGKKEIHDPAYAPQITGIEKPFEKILGLAGKLLESDIPFEGTKKALEASAAVAAIQDKSAPKFTGLIELNPGKIAADIKAGSFALKDLEITVPKNSFIGLMQELLEALGVEESELIDITDRVIELSGGGKILMVPYSAFSDEMIQQVMEASGARSAVVEAALNAAWQVILANIAVDIYPYVKNEMWSGMGCPICGAGFEMAKFAADEGHMYLSCPQCLTQWKYVRMKCPWCGEENQKKLGFFTAQEYPGYRVNFCRTCNQYWKIAVEKNLNRDYVPVVDYLNTLELDLQARNEGFEES